MSSAFTLPEIYDVGRSPLSSFPLFPSYLPHNLFLLQLPWFDMVAASSLLLVHLLLCHYQQHVPWAFSGLPSYYSWLRCYSDRFGMGFAGKLEEVCYVLGQGQRQRPFDRLFWDSRWQYNKVMPRNHGKGRSLLHNSDEASTWHTLWRGAYINLCAVTSLKMMMWPYDWIA